jgi:tRNA1Val (adenine37-N6)-methyltransferase
MKIGTDGILLGAWAGVSGAGSILDVGTGTGVIAIILAQRAQQAVIHGVEIERDACEQANENMQRSPWPNRLTAFHASIQEFARTAETKYDLIVSNPPFFSGGTFSSSQDKASVRHTVKLPHGDLLTGARTLLKKDGKFCAILPHLEGLRFKEMAGNYNLFCTKITEVRSKPGKPVERLLLQFEHELKPLMKNELTIQHEAHNSWTPEYLALTGDFYASL